MAPDVFNYAYLRQNVCAVFVEAISYRLPDFSPSINWEQNEPAHLKEKQSGQAVKPAPLWLSCDLLCLSRLSKKHVSR